MIDKQIAWIEKQLLAEQDTLNCPIKRKNSNPKKFQWTGTQVELVELVYSLHETKIINDGNTTLKELFAELGDFLDFRVTDFYRFYGDITKRVGDRTLFLDKLKKGLMRKLSESDNRQY